MSRVRIQRNDFQAVQTALDQLADSIDRLPKPAVQETSKASTRGTSPVLVQQAPAPLGEVTIDSVHGLRAELGRIEASIQDADVPLASVSTAGIVRLSCSPASPSDPVALSANDPLLAKTLGKTHYQSIPSDTWVVVHDFGFVPSIEVVDSGGSELNPEIIHDPPLAPTATVLIFFAATSGIARLH